MINEEIDLYSYFGFERNGASGIYKGVRSHGEPRNIQNETSCNACASGRSLSL